MFLWKCYESVVFLIKGIYESGQIKQSNEIRLKIYISSIAFIKCAGINNIICRKP